MKAPENLTPAYIESKRAQLLKLRDQVQNAINLASGKEAVKQGYGDAQAPEDDAQKLEFLETAGNLMQHEGSRLAQINRALRKIEDGTYGYSDVSGQRISAERLDALPEATTTLQEQSARE